MTAMAHSSTDSSIDSSSPTLHAKGVTAGYAARTILRGLDLAVHPGEIYALLGANGAGKSTALNLFLGFLRPR
jgi:ABC-2 type transport system ATP-binding protein